MLGGWLKWPSSYFNGASAEPPPPPAAASSASTLASASLGGASFRTAHESLASDRLQPTNDEEHRSVGPGGRWETKRGLPGSSPPPQGAFLHQPHGGLPAREQTVRRMDRSPFRITN